MAPQSLSLVCPFPVYIEQFDGVKSLAKVEIREPVLVQNTILSGVENCTDFYERRMNGDFRKGSVPIGDKQRNDNGNSTMMLITLIFLIGFAMMGASINAMMTENQIADRDKQIHTGIQQFANR